MKKIIINKEPWQTRIATTLNGELQNIYFSTPSDQALERAYFKGVITKVLPGIQTAFVDIGQEKAGFLHISEIDHELAIHKFSEAMQLDEDAPRPARPRQAVDIKKIFKEGEAVLVQVSKEPIYEKGAKLTTCFTLPGRFIVLMPNIPRIGVSKKVEAREERIRLKEIVQTHLPPGMGAIIRTTSEGATAKQLTQDIAFLVNTWRAIQKKFEAAKPTERIHDDLEISLQVVRDHLDEDVESVVVDDKDTQNKIYKFVKHIAPEYTHKIAYYDNPVNIFDHFNITKQLEASLEKRVNLKSGGSLIIESTEAMTVVDVNTGRFIGKTNLEDTILKTNLEAAGEVVRQLRLRNIGGLIVIDFIDMASSANRHKLFNFFEKTLREQDKFQSVVLKISEFGLVQMTRKRSGKTLVQQLTDDCPTCRGSGFIKSLQTECYTVFQGVKTYLRQQHQHVPIVLQVSPSMFDYITGNEYNPILQLEKLCTCKIELESRADFEGAQYKIQKR
ncbi:MAG TPA: Rne/Rng family ribonuclease [Candidatus Limnocylindria bacterium]|nr:Rne/Rng family ribonuclease [Candidatus Limnocylindria bacterium]